MSVKINSLTAMSHNIRTRDGKWSKLQKEKDTYQPNTKFTHHACKTFCFVAEEDTLYNITAASERGSYAKPLWYWSRRYHLTRTTLCYGIALKLWRLNSLDCLGLGIMDI